MGTLSMTNDAKTPVKPGGGVVTVDGGGSRVVAVHSGGGEVIAIHGGGCHHHRGSY